MNEADADWAEPARNHAQRLLRQVRLLAAEVALATGDVHVAREIAERSLLADRLDETAWRAMMLAHQCAGEPGEALAAYERLRARLAAEPGTGPAKATRDLHLAVLQEQGMAPLQEETTLGTRTVPLAGLAGPTPTRCADHRPWTGAGDLGMLDQRHPPTILTTPRRTTARRCVT